MDTQAQTPVKLIVYFVNGEKQETKQHELTVRTILTNAGFTPAEDYRLVRDAGNHAYTDLDEEIPLHENERFTALFQGPTPTS